MSTTNNGAPLGGDASGRLANDGQVVEIFHVPTGWSVKFKAMMTQFEDAYTSEWNSESVYGRMDPIQTFQRTGRVISVGFSVVADGERRSLKLIFNAFQHSFNFFIPRMMRVVLIKNSPYCKIQFMNWSALIPPIQAMHLLLRLKRGC